MARSRHWGSGFLRSFVSVALAGAIIAAVSAALGGPLVEHTLMKVLATAHEALSIRWYH
jgi:Tfp pilus assembly major pilin PilA